MIAWACVIGAFMLVAGLFTWCLCKAAAIRDENHRQAMRSLERQAEERKESEVMKNYHGHE